MNGFVSQPLDVTAFVRTAPVGAMETKVRINSFIGHFAGAETARKQFQQTQQQGQSLALEIRRQKCPWVRTCGFAPKATRDAIGGGSAQRVISIRSDGHDETGAWPRFC